MYDATWSRSGKWGWHAVRLIVLCSAIAVGLSVWFAQPLYAQDEGAQQEIPVACRACEFRPAPDGSKAVVFENAAIVGDEAPQLARLPIRIVDLANGKIAGRLVGHTDYVTDADFSPDGKRLATIHSNGVIQIWDMARRRTIRQFPTTIGGGKIRYLSDGERLVVLTPGPTSELRVVDAETGAITQILRKPVLSLYAYREAFSDITRQMDMNFCGLAVAPDGETVVVATANDELGIWSLETGSYQVLDRPAERKATFARCDLHFSADGATLYYLDTQTKQADLWDWASLEKRSAPLAETERMSGLALSPDGAALAWAAQVDGVPAVLLAPVDAPEAVVDSGLVVIDTLRVAPRITALHFLPDGSGLVAGGFLATDDENAIYVVGAETAP